MSFLLKDNQQIDLELNYPLVLEVKYQRIKRKLKGKYKNKKGNIILNKKTLKINDTIISYNDFSKLSCQKEKYGFFSKTKYLIILYNEIKGNIHISQTSKELYDNLLKILHLYKEYVVKYSGEYPHYP